MEVKKLEWEEEDGIPGVICYFWTYIINIQKHEKLDAYVGKITLHNVDMNIFKEIPIKFPYGLFKTLDSAKKNYQSMMEQFVLECFE